MKTKIVQTLADEILGPLSRRLGTAFGAYMIANGVASDTAHVIVTGLLAAFGVAVDLVISHQTRKAR